MWTYEDIKDSLVQRDFGRLCQLVRERGHLRQEDIALLTGLSQAFLSMLESGQRRLTNIDRIIVLLDGLNAPADLTGPMLRQSPSGRLHRAKRCPDPAAGTRSPTSSSTSPTSSPSP
ncbi:helix-turn-helix transcriptional regulator [Streptomyces sp. Edi2]|uniref:helix-turn-helix domain-containing protein n=1 Tax=Streptomyces sp. Edi2 TaxID=3162528 RepID=UPI003305BCAA